MQKKPNQNKKPLFYIIDKFQDQATNKGTRNEKKGKIKNHIVVWLLCLVSF